MMLETADIVGDGALMSLSSLLPWWPKAGVIYPTQGAGRRKRTERETHTHILSTCWMPFAYDPSPKTSHGQGRKCCDLERV